MLPLWSKLPWSFFFYFLFLYCFFWAAAHSKSMEASFWITVLWTSSSYRICVIHLKSCPPGSEWRMSEFRPWTDQCNPQANTQIEISASDIGISGYVMCHKTILFNHLPEIFTFILRITHILKWMFPGCCSALWTAWIQF